MADPVCDGEAQPVKPPPKRRRILDPSAIVPVPVYSNKVSSSLQLKPRAAAFMEEEPKDDAADESLWFQFSSRDPSDVILLSDSEEDEKRMTKKTDVDSPRCPSPPPLQSPVTKQSRKVKKKIREVDKRLQELNSFLSPEQQHTSRLRPSPLSSDDLGDDDVIVMTPSDSGETVAVTPPSPYCSVAREIPLKIRCRADIHKIPVLSSVPLRDVVSQLSLILGVPPPRLLLMREDMELPTDSTISELGIGIADIIECVVMAAEDKAEAVPSSSSSITVRLQGKDRKSLQEFTLLRDSPLGSIFSQYVSSMSAGSGMAARFQFDGSQVRHSQTPAELDMEDGDLIEVWT
ncbi:NFATC2-interacting protein isoform X2 [Antennarius striatus]|uniref:NFATC2-interacting protein isoform X2 n=1 Tax=Antennarius striatus TaxID=241820 RepID=UPI0035B0CD25